MIATEAMDILEAQANQLIEKVKETLVESFHKNEEEARNLVDQSQLLDKLLTDPIGLHDSPEKWALIILTELEDLEAIELYYKSFAN
ncbi:hypothetical protein [Mangrovibacillus cuniculi]|uniref:Uncharacterized protein n=1 Tax=Mangrovibacillus cuniculi TaxID=2593652 RepID=A0A7S8C8Z7_9BACI|nr:hypothetical protein [Mangrovibacillus cuniculi]QPC45609.1 hypothetical protein G8O30_00765 [Mangrovibacillus cuniculi]